MLASVIPASISRACRPSSTRGAGTFRLKHKLLFIANALKQHEFGLEETDDGIWPIYLGAVLLVKVDEGNMIIRD